MKIADVLISEESSTLYEAVMLEKPVIAVTDWLVPDRTPPREPIFPYDFALHIKKKDIRKTIQDVLSDETYKEKIAQYSRENFPNKGTAAKAVMDVLDSVLYGAENSVPRIEEKTLIDTPLEFEKSVSAKKKLMQNHKRLLTGNYIDVFYDTGNGFSGEEKDTFVQFPVTVSAPTNLRALRIDPLARHCIVQGVSLKADGKEMGFSSNAYFADENICYFDTSDPQLYVELPEESVSSFTFDMKVFELNQSVAMHIKKLHDSDFAQKSEPQKTIDCLQKELAALHSSWSWRVTAPMRFLRKLFWKR